MPELAQIQQRFADGLLGADLDPGIFRGDAAHAGRCFAIYRGNAVANREHALANAYPVLKRLVGEDFFRALARELWHRAPSAAGDLNGFGEGLDALLQGFAPVAPYPYMPAVAALEWALHQAHYAPDSQALDAAELARLDPAVLGDIRLALRPGCRVLAFGFDIPALWLAHQQADVTWPADLERPVWCLVCRPHWRAEPLPLSAGEHAVLAALAQGHPLGEALEQGAQADAALDPGATLPRWIQSRIFLTLTQAGPTGPQEQP